MGLTGIQGLGFEFQGGSGFGASEGFGLKAGSIYPTTAATALSKIKTVS